MAESIDNLYNLLKKDTNYSSAKSLATPEVFKNSFSSEESMDNLYNLLKGDKNYSSARVLSSPEVFKKSFFNIEPTQPKEEAGFFSGLTSRFRDLFGTEKDQTSSYLKELNKKHPGALPKSDWEVYNDFTNLLKPVGKPLSSDDYIVADNYLKSIGVTSSGNINEEDNPFTFNLGKIENKDQYLKAKDDIENIKRDKIKSIKGFYDSQIEAEKQKGQAQYGYIYRPIETILGTNPTIQKLEKDRDKQIQEVEDQFDSYVSNISQPQIVKTDALVKPEDIGIAQLNKNVNTNPVTGRKEFDTKQAIFDVNSSTTALNNFADQFNHLDKKVVPGDATSEEKQSIEQGKQLDGEWLKSGRPIPKGGFTLNSELYNKFGQYGIDMQYAHDNRTRDIKTSNFNYGQIKELKKQFLTGSPETTDIERDGYVFNGLKGQIQTVDSYIAASQKQLDDLSENIGNEKDPKRKENADFVNSLNQNISSLKNLKQQLIQWGDKNLTGYKKYLASKEEIERINNDGFLPSFGGTLSDIGRLTANLPGEAIQFGERIGLRINKDLDKKEIATEYGSKRSVPLEEFYLSQMESPILKDVESSVFQKGAYIPVSQAQAIYKSKEGSPLNPLNYSISLRPAFVSSITTLRDMYLLGFSGALLEEAGTKVLGSGMKMLAEGSAKESLGWTLEKQIAKNIASAGIADAAGESVLKYNIANAAIGAARFGNRAVAMTIPTAVLYGNQMHKQFVDAGFTPEQSMKLASLSILFEGSSEAIFGNEIKFYNALVDGTGDAAVKRTATETLERAFADRAKKVLGKELSRKELSFLTKLWTGFQKFKDSKEVSSILEGTKMGVEESLEEIYSNVGSSFVTSPLGRSYNPEYKGDDFTLENQVLTAMNTVATMIPTILTSAGAHYKNFNKNQKIEGLQAKYEVGAAPEVHIGILHDLFNKGEISKDEYEKRTVLVNKYSENLNKAHLNSLPAIVKNGYSASEADSLRFSLFSSYLEREKLEQQFTQALTDDDKATFAQLISEKDEQIAKYINNGLYENDEERREINNTSLDYLFNPNTIKAYTDEKRLTAVMDQLVTQSLVEKDPELVKKYEEKINLLDARKKELIEKAKEDVKTPEQKAAENNAKGNISIPGMGIGELQLEFNTPYYYSPNTLSTTEEGHKVRTNDLMTILKDNGDGTLQVSINGEEKSIPISDVANSRMLKEETVKNWNEKNSPLAFVFNHENDSFTFEFDKPAKTRDKAVEGRIAYNPYDKTIELVYKNKKGEEARYTLTKDDIKNINKGRLKYVKTYETNEQFNNRKSRMEELARKVDFDELSDEPFRRWKFITDFIERKTEELQKTKESIKSIQDKLAEAKKTFNQFIDNINDEKSVDVQDVFSIANDLKQKIKELEWNLHVLEEQKDDIEEQIEYTKRYDKPEFDTKKTLIDELVDDQFKLEVQLEKVNGVIDSLKEMINSLSDLISDVLNVIDSVYQKAKSLYPKIPIDNTRWTEFVRQNPNITSLKPDFAKDLTLFSSVINDNLDKIEVQDKKVQDLNKSIEANISVAKNIQDQIRFQEELIREAVKNQKKYEEEKVEKKILSRAAEIFNSTQNNKTSSQTNLTEDDEKLSKDEAQKIPLEIFFNTATSGTTFEGGFNLDDPATLKLQNFSNNIQDPENYSMRVVTVDNAKQYGLQDIIFTDDKITNTGDNEDNYDIKLVIVNKKTGNFVDQNGNETSYPKQYVYTSLRRAYTTWTNGEKAYPVRKGKEEDDEKIAKLYEKKHKELRAELITQIKNGVSQRLDIEYTSRGRRVQDGKLNPAVGTVLPANTDLVNQKVIAVAKGKEEGHKTGQLTYGNGNVVINMPIGRPVLSLGNTFEFLHNKKFNKQDVDKFVKIFKALYDSFKTNDVNTRNTILQYLTKTLYFRSPSETNLKEAQETKIGRSQIWVSNVLGVPYLNFGSEGGRIPFNFEEGNVNAFFSLYAFFTGKDGKGVYHNVDIKNDGEGLVGKSFIEITDVKDGKLVTREWASYQSYLLSDRTPTGAARSIEEIPLMVNIQPSTANTPNRAGRYIVYKNDFNDDVTKANPRKSIVEKKADGKQSKKTNLTGANKDAKVEFKEQFSEEIQNIKNLKPGKIYRWKSEKEGVMKYIDFTFSDKKYVKIIDSNYGKGGDMMDHATIAKSLNSYLKEGKQKPSTVIIYEIIPTKNKAEVKESTKTENKKQPKKKIKKEVEDIEEEEAGEEFEDFEESVESFNLAAWGAEKDTEGKKGKPSTQSIDANKSISDPDGEAKLVDAMKAFFQADAKDATDEDVAKAGEEFRKAVKQAGEYKLENLQKAKEWWTERFPQIPFNDVFGLINNKAWGVIKNATITLSHLAEEGTVYHEAFEAVHKYLLTGRETKALYKEFRRRQGSFIDYETGKSVEYSKATNYQIKEQLSEEYREYELSGKTKIWKGEYRKTSLFEKISDFVDLIVNKLLGASDNIATIFNKISDGAYKDHVLPASNNEINPEYKVATGVNSLKRTNPILFRRMMDSITNLLFESIRNQDTPIIDILSNDFKINDSLKTVKNKLSSFYNVSVESPDGKIGKLKDFTKQGTKEQFIELFKDMKISALFYKRNNGTALMKNLVDIMKEKDYIPKNFTLETTSENIAGKAASFYNAMQRGGSSILYDAVSNFNYINDNWEDIAKEHKNFLAKYSLDFQTDEEEAEDNAISDENASGTEYAQETTKVSKKKNASFEIKLLIATLREMVYDYTKVSKFAEDVEKTARAKINELLLSNVVDYGKVFTNLLYKLSPSTNIDEMFEILQQEAETDATIASLVDKLKIGKTNLTSSDIDLRSKFYVSMNSLLVKYSKVLIFPDSKMSFITDLNELDDFNNIREKWVSATVSNDSKIIKLNRKTGEYEVVKDFPFSEIKNIKTAFDFLNYLGYEFNFDSSSLDSSEKETVLKSAINLLKLLKTTKNPEVLMQDSGTIRGALNDLAEVYMKYTSTYAEPQHLNIEREPVQNILLHNFIGTIAKTLNSSRTLQEFIDRIPQLNPNTTGNGFLTFSQVLNPRSKFYRDGVLSKKLSIQIMEGSEVLESGKGIPTSKLTLKDRVAQEFAYNLAGLYYILTPADTKTQWGINFGEFVTQEQSRDIPTITRLFKQYLKAEIVAAQQENIANLERLDKYHDDAKTKQIKTSLRFFRDILPFELDLTKTPEQAIAEKENDINKAIIDYIDEETNETYDYFNNEGLIIPYKEGEEEDGFVSISNDDKFTIMFAPTEFMGEGKTKEELKDLIRYSNINYIFNIFEQHKLFWGDPAQWKDISKRVKSFTSGRNLSVNRDTAFNDHHNTKLNTVHYIDKNGDQQTITLQPGDFGYVHYNDEIRTTTYLDVTVENNDLEGYNDINEADAQGIAFPNGYREMRQRATTWEEADQEQHEWDMALCRWEVTNGIKWEDRNKNNPKSIGIKENLYPEGKRGEMLKERDEAILSSGNPYLVRKQLSSENNNIKTAITNVLKPIYSGFKKAFVDGSGDRTDINSAVVNLDKLSLAPMTWRLVRGKHAQKFFVEHVKKNTTYTKFESAQKVGMRNDVESLYNNDGSINLKLDKNGNSTNIKHDILDFKYFGIQVETKSQKNTATLGTQLTKLITLNVDKFKNKILVDNNSRFLRALKEMSKRQIFSDFGIEETKVNGEKVYKFKNFETVQKLIQEEFKKRDTPENLKDAIQLDKDGKFYLKFDMVIGAERVESIITSIIDKNILRPKMFGGQMPQISSALFENNKRFVKKVVNGKPVLTSNELKFYKDKNGERYCEVYLPFYMKEFIENGKELSIDDIPDELRFGIGFRIPTQNTNSLENFKIKGFLPVEYGNSIVVPSEITKKAGSDFDIDKLNIYLYNYFIKDGKPQKITFDDRPSFDENGRITDAARERYEINEKRRDPKAYEIRKEYRQKIKDVKAQIQAQWEKDSAEIKRIKSQKTLSESENDQFFIAKKQLEAKVKYLEKDLKDLNDIIKDFEKGFNEDYDSTKLTANIFGYSGDSFSVLNQMDREIQSIQNDIENYQSEINDISDNLKEISLTKYRKEHINKVYEDREKNTKYLQDIKQELIKKEAEEIQSIVPERSLEQFAKLPIEMQNSRKAVENAYIDNIRAILELPEMFHLLTKPNSADELKKEATDINSLYGINREVKSSTYYISRLRNAEDRHAFLIGKDAVGIAASHQTQHAISQLVGLSFDNKQIAGFDLFFDCNSTTDDDKTTYSLHDKFDKAGKLISDTISMFIDSAVDIAKDPYVFDINGNYNTFSIYLTGIRLGIPLNLITRWFNQPVIREYVKLMQQNKSISSAKVRKKEMIELAKQKVLSDVSYPERDGNFTIEELENLIKDYVKDPNNTSIEFKQAQALLLDQFVLLENLSWDLFRFGQAINLDTSRTVSFESIRIKIFKIKAALDGPFSDYVKKVFNDTFIGSIYKTKNEFLDAIKPLYLTESDQARSVLNPILEKIYSAMGSQDDLEDAARNLRKHFINYLIHTAAIKFDGNKNPTIITSLIKKLLMEDTSKLTSNELRKVQARQKDGKLSENFFTSNLLGTLTKFAKLSGKTVNNVQVTRRMLDKTDNDLTVADFRNLGNDVETYNLAQDLLKTALLQSGIITDPKSFSQFIPNEMFYEIAKQIQDQFENIGTDQIPEQIKNFKNSYFQNLWWDRALVPKVTKRTSPTAENPEGKERLVPFWLTTTTEVKVIKRGEEVIKKKPSSIKLYQYWAHSTSNRGFKPSRDVRRPFLIDISVDKISPRKIAAMKKAGDFSFMKYTLYKRIEIERPDGKIDVPLAQKYGGKDKNGVDQYNYYVLYYPVHRYGQRFTSIEHYANDNAKSQVNDDKIPSLTNEKVYTNLKNNGKMSDIFLYQDIIPTLAEKDDDTIHEVKEFMGLSKEKEVIDNFLFEEEEKLPTVPEATPTVTTEVIEQPIQNKEGIKTLQDVENKAIAVIKSTKGDDKYIFLNSQKGLFGNDLISDDKQGQRLKGKNYKGIDIVSDYFTSKTIKDKSGKDTVDILFVDNKEDAQKQFDNYIKGGAKQFSSIKFVEQPIVEEKPLENPDYDPNNDPNCPF